VTDPAHTGKSYHVDPNADLSEVVLREVRGMAAQSAMKLFIATHFRSNIKAIRYSEESHGAKGEPRSA
jgi:hypothetical protein